MPARCNLASATALCKSGLNDPLKQVRNLPEFISNPDMAATGTASYTSRLSHCAPEILLEMIGQGDRRLFDRPRCCAISGEPVRPEGVREKLPSDLDLVTQSAIHEDRAASQIQLFQGMIRFRSET